MVSSLLTLLASPLSPPLLKVLAKALVIFSDPFLPDPRGLVGPVVLRHELALCSGAVIGACGTQIVTIPD
jgi:hypothetical protein